MENRMDNWEYIVFFGARRSQQKRVPFGGIPTLEFFENGLWYLGSALGSPCLWTYAAEV